MVGEAYIDIDMYRDSALAAGREILKAAQARARAAKVRATSEIVETLIHDASDAIIAEARRARADLIVLGTHGRTGLARLFLGSVAEGVVGHATGAVLLIRPKASARKGTKRRR
jgi:nucleotide-binding universal stress UspA family protein